MAADHDATTVGDGAGGIAEHAHRPGGPVRDVDRAIGRRGDGIGEVLGRQPGHDAPGGQVHDRERVRHVLGDVHASTVGRERESGGIPGLVDLGIPGREDDAVGECRPVLGPPVDVHHVLCRARGVERLPVRAERQAEERGVLEQRLGDRARGAVDHVEAGLAVTGARDHDGAPARARAPYRTAWRRGDRTGCLPDRVERQWGAGAARGPSESTATVPGRPGVQAVDRSRVTQVRLCFIMGSLIVVSGDCGEWNSSQGQVRFNQGRHRVRQDVSTDDRHRQNWARIHA